MNTDINKVENDTENNKDDISEVENSIDIRDSEEESNPYYVKFSNTISHGGKDYEGLDMSKVRDLTTKEKIEIDRIYERMESVKPRNPMLSTMYALCVAHYVTKLPLEFFYRMRNFEFIKIEAAVKTAFFLQI